MPRRHPHPHLIATIALLAAAGCAKREGPVAVAGTPAVAPPRPTLPAGYGAVIAPPRDAEGNYRTINSELDGQATVWHLRAALNVAAIGCRGPEAATIVPAYNAMLTTRKAALARARRSVQAGIQATSGKDWQTADDAFMTRLYNYFAMPAAKPAFCAAAAEVAPQVSGVAPPDLETFAAGALAKLEAPFTSVYRTVDDYRIASAAWDARYGPGAPVQVAVAATAFAAVDTGIRKPPKLAYRDIGDVIAFVPRKGEALAAR